MIELTGTPTPHGLTDLWSQIYLLDGGKRLGRTVSVYRDMFFCRTSVTARRCGLISPVKGRRRQSTVC